MITITITRGADWGESGYIRLKRGVGMCGIGKTIATVECQEVRIRIDHFANIAEFLRSVDRPARPSPPPSPAWTSTATAPSWPRQTARLMERTAPRLSQGALDYFLTSLLHQSCGLCDGMTPHVSNTCADSYNNCASLAANYCYRFGSSCCMSCGLGEMMMNVWIYS